MNTFSSSNLREVSLCNSLSTAPIHVQPYPSVMNWRSLPTLPPLSHYFTFFSKRGIVFPQFFPPRKLYLIKNIHRSVAPNATRLLDLSCCHHITFQFEGLGKRSSATKCFVPNPSRSLCSSQERLMKYDIEKIELKLRRTDVFLTCVLDSWLVLFSLFVCFCTCFIWRLSTKIRTLELTTLQGKNPFPSPCKSMSSSLRELMKSWEPWFKSEKGK